MKIWLLLVPVICLFSCTKEEYRRTYTGEPPTPVVIPVTPAPAADTSSKTYLALGDSYTIGQSVSIEERFPNQVAALLLATGVKFERPEIIAQTGWTTGNLLQHLQSSPPKKSKYDIVSLLIGVNNQYQRLTQAQYRDEFGILLDKAIGYTGNNRARVFVLSIPDYSVTPFGSGPNSALISRQIDSFNVINKQVTITEGCNYVEITLASQAALTDASLVASDGLHPSGTEYRKWALLLAQQIQNALK